MIPPIAVNALLGQENQNISANYLEMGHLKEHIDSVHQQTLRQYQLNYIAIKLIEKGQQLWLKEGKVKPLTDLDFGYYNWIWIKV